MPRIPVYGGRPSSPLPFGRNSTNLKFGGGTTLGSKGLEAVDGDEAKVEADPVATEAEPVEADPVATEAEPVAMEEEVRAGVNPVVDRSLEEAPPLPKVDRFQILLNQCLKIFSARNLHIPAGYAAVGAV